MPTYTDIAEIAGDTRIDSRDLIEFADALRADIIGGERMSDEDIAALAAIDALAEEGITDWEYGASFIREDTFTEYAQELAEDIGAMPEGNRWPTYCIDWEYAARELSVDYTSVSFLGHDYLVRA